MSYMRMNYPLRYFKGNSKSYVFHCSHHKRKKYDFVEDYNDQYKDNASFCELIGNIVMRETSDEKYSEKIIKILAKKLRVEYKLRKIPLTYDQWWKLANKNLEKFKQECKSKPKLKIFSELMEKKK